MLASLVTAINSYIMALNVPRILRRYQPADAWKKRAPPWIERRETAQRKNGSIDTIPGKCHIGKTAFLHSPPSKRSVHQWLARAKPPCQAISSRHRLLSGVLGRWDTWDVNGQIVKRIRSHWKGTMLCDWAKASYLCLAFRREIPAFFDLSEKAHGVGMNLLTKCSLRSLQCSVAVVCLMNVMLGKAGWWQ